jgi:hypothetical protein
VSLEAKLFISIRKSFGKNSRFESIKIFSLDQLMTTRRKSIIFDTVHYVIHFSNWLLQLFTVKFWSCKHSALVIHTCTRKQQSYNIVYSWYLVYWCITESTCTSYNWFVCVVWLLTIFHGLVISSFKVKFSDLEYILFTTNLLYIYNCWL